jgi:hypothetical protein
MSGPRMRFKGAGSAWTRKTQARGRSADARGKQSAAWASGRARPSGRPGASTAVYCLSLSGSYT